MPATDDLSVSRGISLLLRQRHLIVRALAVFAVASLLLAFRGARTHTAQASFSVQGQRSGALQGLAAQFGITVPGQDAAPSPNFYLDLIRGNEIMGAVVDSTLTAADAAPVDEEPLKSVFALRDETPDRRRARAIMALRSRVTANVAQRTGVVSFRVVTPDPELSRDLASRILEELNAFNLINRQTQAAAEKRFAERRLTEVKQDFDDAERALLAFAESNRETRNSPQLQVRQGRLERAVSFQQQLYGSLAQAVEQARLEEFRDTPAIMIVERPRAPAFPDGRGSRRKLLVGTFLGLLVGIVFASIADGVRRRRERTLDEQDVREQFAGFLRDLRRPWSLLMPPR